MMPTSASKNPAIVSGVGENLAGAVPEKTHFSRAAGSNNTPLQLAP